jgi:uncharacterized protein (UPF0332 family)
MIEPKQELINFRLNRADEAFDMATLGAGKKYWNSVASELYYTCYYLVIALFAKNDIKTSTHSGVRTVLGSQYIKGGLLEAKWGKLFTLLFDLRQEGDYRDFKKFDESEILPLINEVEEFRDIIKGMLAGKY